MFKSLCVYSLALSPSLESVLTCVSLSPAVFHLPSYLTYGNAGPTFVNSPPMIMFYLSSTLQQDSHFLQPLSTYFALLSPITKKTNSLCANGSRRECRDARQLRTKTSKFNAMQFYIQYTAVSHSLQYFLQTTKVMLHKHSSVLDVDILFPSSTGRWCLLGVVCLVLPTHKTSKGIILQCIHVLTCRVWSV